MTDTTPKPRPDAAELLYIAFECARSQNNPQAMADAAAALAELERGQPITVNVTTPPIEATPEAERAGQCWSGLTRERRRQHIHNLTRGARRLVEGPWQSTASVSGGRCMTVEQLVVEEQAIEIHTRHSMRMRVTQPSPCEQMPPAHQAEVHEEARPHFAIARGDGCYA